MKSRDLDMSGPAKASPGGQVLTANLRKYFFFSQQLHLSFLSADIPFFNQNVSFSIPNRYTVSYVEVFWGPARPGGPRRAGQALQATGPRGGGPPQYYKGGCCGSVARAIHNKKRCRDSVEQMQQKMQLQQSINNYEHASHVR